MNRAVKALSNLGALVSPKPLKRVLAAERLLSVLLHRLPPDVQNAHFELAPELRADQLRDAKLYPSREAMLHILPKGGIAAEVGTYKGDFSKKIAAICRPDVLHLLDLDFGPFKEEPLRQAIGNGAIQKHQGDSATTLRNLPVSHFDWLYIDGDHTYDGVVADLSAAHRAVKPGGYLMCNDYTNWDMSSAVPYGVAKAINEFCLAMDYTVTGFALQGAGFHDILLRKPG